jgi:DNA-binding NtrC family response regulator
MPLIQLFVDEILSVRRGGGTGREDSRAVRLAEKAARLECPVLIEGEPGLGGDALARAIHECGERRGKPFIRIHASRDGDEVAAAFFGTDRSTQDRRRGRLSEAHGGTLLMQGIEDLPGNVQIALLRAIQHREVQPLGASRPVRTDVRFIATCHANLADRVRAGSFREDLYYRLQVLPITLAPLRARLDDVPPLAEAFLARFAGEEGKVLTGLSPDAVCLLRAYDWPGNLRQLENAVYRAVALAEGCTLTATEFPQIAARVAGFGVVIPPVPRGRAADWQVVPLEGRNPHAIGLLDEGGEMRRLADLEAEIIRFALAHYQGHMSAISRHLGIGRSTLYRKLKELGLENVSADAAA